MPASLPDTALASTCSSRVLQQHWLDITERMHHGNIQWTNKPFPCSGKKGQTWDVWWTYIHWSKHFWNLGDPSGKSHQQKADRKEKIRRKAYFTTRVPSQLDEGFSHLCCLANSRRAAFEYCSLCAAPFVCSTSWLALQRIGSRGRFLAWHEGQDETSCQGRYVQCMMFLHRWCMMMLLWGYTNYHKPVYSNSIFLKQCIVAITSHNNTTWSAISTPDVCRLLYRTSTRTDSGPVHFAAPSPGYLGQHLSDSCFDQSCAWSCSAELRLKTWMVGNIMLPIVF